MIIRINDKIPLFSRYNGGWIKTIERLDKDYKNGYSLVGEFLPVSSGNIDLDEGIIYLDCSIDGSRKNQEKNYTLFKLVDGEIIIIQSIENGSRDWATSLWDTIETELDSTESKVDELTKQIMKLNPSEFLDLMEELRKHSKEYQTFLAVLLEDFLLFENFVKEGKLERNINMEDFEKKE